MFAIILTGGKQYKVKAGDELLIERLGEKTPKTLKLDKVLLVSKDGSSADFGSPFVKGAYVDADLLAETKSPKTFSFKYIRREKSATKRGHRQKYLKIKIKTIHAGA